MFMKIKRKHCKLSNWSKGPGLKLLQQEKMLRNLLEEYVIISLLLTKLRLYCLLWRQCQSLAVMGWKVSHAGLLVITIIYHYYSLSLIFLHLWDKSGVGGGGELRGPTVDQQKRKGLGSCPGKVWGHKGEWSLVLVGPEADEPSLSMWTTEAAKGTPSVFLWL